jgi:hypothetical protein
MLKGSAPTLLGPGHGVDKVGLLVGERQLVVGDKITHKALLVVGAENSAVFFQDDGKRHLYEPPWRELNVRLHLGDLVSVGSRPVGVRTRETCRKRALCSESRELGGFGGHVLQDIVSSCDFGLVCHDNECLVLPGEEHI